MALPTVDSYLAGVPGGHEGHPACEVKASIYRSLLDEHPLDEGLVGELPPPVADLVRSPRPVSTWVSEVQSTAVLLAVADAHFAGDAERYLQTCFEIQRRLFSGKLYRLAFSLVGPSMLLRGAASRWKGFHKGSAATATRAEGGTDLQLDYPEGLYQELPLRALGEGFRAALVVAGAQETQLELAEHGATSARFRARWRE